MTNSTNFVKSEQRWHHIVLGSALIAEAEAIALQKRSQYQFVLCLVYALYPDINDGRVKPKPRATATAAKSSVKSNKASQHTADAEYRCLIRAVLGSKKISTVIAQKDVNKFQLAYCNLLKGNMDGLKKKEKAAKSKAKVQAI
ncbi:hypothetical protein CAPTEDRAFT_223855 [Capitella teleta]|uniref:Signal recognition particle 14 kDa protein n=1 Tax=Capitella teleta TaxID=283909 RepID=R7TR80_CAPTE|nr:hypothetical protein CAPTEDRAFT_223855 [Capitella teleta]|eukprot:ELT93540.1 hypothetical protein CAPTEDRAFT_223855 [Capitella teleta]